MAQPFGESERNGVARDRVGTRRRPIMEEKQSGQDPQAEQRTATDATAGRTRPIDATGDLPPDPEGVRVAQRAADGEVATMKARGFGSHKGTEAD
ncbi:MAG TPA: hypothetical protein VF649_11080 [Sphingomonas sp.]|jgi:hypothetical protein|uniref:hypothetical protein n=1 Tax=Sphingomonas sp. TaxID=28214 RepID=UPI002ED9BB95